MPDGTRRQRFGKMGASSVEVGDMLRALKVQWMGNEKRENWADTVIHQLKRLTYASESEVKDIYMSICAVATHADMANKGIVVEISRSLGEDWIPGPLFCFSTPVWDSREVLKMSG